VIKLSDSLNKLVGSTIEACYPDNEGLLTSYKQSIAQDDLKLQTEQKQLEADQTRLETDKKSLEEQSVQLENEVARVERRQAALRIALLGVLLALVAAIGVAGIVFTHKIAGPIFKMKRLFRNVGEGKLVLREKLRKGDELQHFFEAFESMVNNLGEKQKREIEQIDAVLAKFDTSGESYRSTSVEEQTDAIKKLRKLRADMHEQITP
jgi:nitrogen fixation/metabolism regulation signal transduction histidine kinase